MWAGPQTAPYLLAAALTPPATVAGGWAGAWLWWLVDEPARPAAWRVALGWTLGLPLLTGAVDLAVRVAVP